MITLVLFAALTLVLIPLLHRDMNRAVERRRVRLLAADHGWRFARLGAALAQSGASMAVAGNFFRSAAVAAQSAEQTLAKLNAAMQLQATSIRDLRYRLRIDRERDLAHQHLGELLDDWCRSYGWDPLETWRMPRAEEARARAFRLTMSDPDQYKLDALAYAYSATLFQPHLVAAKVIGGIGA